MNNVVSIFNSTGILHYKLYNILFYYYYDFTYYFARKMFKTQRTNSIVNELRHFGKFLNINTDNIITVTDAKIVSKFYTIVVISI